MSARDLFDGLADGMVFSVHGANFQWYFTGPKSFGGILRRSQPFDATQPIFPNKNNKTSRQQRAAPNLATWKRKNWMGTIHTRHP
jgi:hypothetical protein